MQDASLGLLFERFQSLGPFVELLTIRAKGFGFRAKVHRVYTRVPLLCGNHPMGRTTQTPCRVRSSSVFYLL